MQDISTFFFARMTNNSIKNRYFTKVLSLSPFKTTVEQEKPVFVLTGFLGK